MEGRATNMLADAKISRLADGVLRPLDRLYDVLIERAWRERAAIGALSGYLLIWTLYGVIAKSSQDLHQDMAEEIVWSRAPALGYLKHPPFSAMVVRLWFTIFPFANWSYYLLSISIATLSLWIAWRLAGDFLSAEKRVAGLALLTLVPFFNFHALKYNVNTILMPLWGATTFWFLRSYLTQKASYAALAGIGAAACVIPKKCLPGLRRRLRRPHHVFRDSRLGHLKPERQKLAMDSGCTP